VVRCFRIDPEKMPLMLARTSPPGSLPSHFLLGKTLHYMWQYSNVLSSESLVQFTVFVDLKELCLYQVLPEEKCYGSFWNVERNFQRMDNGKDTGVWVAYKVQKRCDLRCRYRKLGTPVNKQTKTWIEWRKLSSKTEESLYMQFLTRWEFHLC
jgi:hypothetical protein